MTLKSEKIVTKVILLYKILKYNKMKIITIYKIYLNNQKNNNHK